MSLTDEFKRITGFWTLISPHGVDERPSRNLIASSYRKWIISRHKSNEDQPRDPSHFENFISEFSPIWLRLAFIWFLQFWLKKWYFKKIFPYIWFRTEKSDWDGSDISGYVKKKWTVILVLIVITTKIYLIQLHERLASL